MKTSLATTISIAGVVAAGAFTFAVNSSMLTSVSTAAEIAPVDAAVLAPGTTGLTVLAPPLTVVVTGSDAGSGVGSQSVAGDRSAATSSSSSSTSSSSSLAPTTTVQVGSSTVSSYSIQGAASVQLVETVNGLTVGSVSPQNGYIYTAESVSATRIVVTLTSSTQKLKFNAELIGGRVVTSLIASEISAPAIAIANAPASTTAPAGTTAPRARTQKAEDKHEEHDDD